MVPTIQRGGEGVKTGQLRKNIFFDALKTTTKKLLKILNFAASLIFYKEMTDLKKYILLIVLLSMLKIVC